MKGCGEKDVASCVWNARAKDYNLLKKARVSWFYFYLYLG